MANDWAHKLLDEVPQTFYGELTFQIWGGEIRRVSRVETLLAPGVKGKAPGEPIRTTVTQFPPPQKKGAG